MPVADAYCRIPLGGKPSDLDPEALDKACKIVIFTFYTFKVLLNMEPYRSSSSSLSLWNSLRPFMAILWVCELFHLVLVIPMIL